MLKALIIVVSLFLSSLAFAKKDVIQKLKSGTRSVVNQETMDIDRDDRNADREQKWKQFFENRKRNQLKSIEKRNSNSEVFSVKEHPCSGQSLSVFQNASCKAKTISRITTQSYYHATYSILASMDKIVLWFKSLWKSTKGSYRNISRNFLSRTNQLPHAGGLFFERRSQGSQPIYYFGTNEEMVDYDGSITKVEFDFGHGSVMTMPVTEVNSFAEVDHAFPATGTYVVSLKIYDDQDEYTEYTQTIDVNNNTIPLNNFSYVVSSGTTLDFSGITNSPTTSFTNYRWNMGDGTGNFTGATLTTKSHTFASTGVYNVTFQAWDNKGARARITKKVYVGQSAPNTVSPYPILRSSTNFGTAPLAVSFDASFSVDQKNNSVSEYEWDFGDFNSIDNFSTSANPTYIYKYPGTYYGYVRIKDANNNFSEKYFRIFVSSGNNQAPIFHAFQFQTTNRYITFLANESGRFSTIDNGQYFYDFGDSESANDVNPEHFYSSGGTYTVQMAAYDVQGIRYVSSKEITIDTDEQVLDIPNASLRLETSTPELNSSVAFYGDESVDSTLSAPLDFVWIFGDGAVFHGPQYDVVQHSFAFRGLYPVRLIVTNSRGLSSETSAVVSVQDGSLLLSNIKYSPKIGPAPLTVSFDSDLSTSSTAAIAEYKWIFNNTPLSRSSTFSTTFQSPGTYNVQLYLKDTLGNESLSSRDVTVVDGGSIPSGNNDPIPNFSIAFQGVDPDKFVFDASMSSDPDPNDYVSYYEWKVDGVEQVDGYILQKTLSVGWHSVELKVFDRYGSSSSLTKVFEVGESQTPEIDFTYSPLAPEVNEQITFNADAGIVPGVDEQSFMWDFGDGHTGNGKEISHTYSEGGTYSVQLSTQDIDGNPLTKTIDVDVLSSPPDVKILISDIHNITEIRDGETYIARDYPETFTFSTNESISDLPIVDEEWAFGDGETAFGPGNVQHTYHKPGTYAVTVKGYDTLGRFETATAEIVIPEDDLCETEDGSDVCLQFNDGASNILPFSANSWTFSHTKGSLDISDDPQDIPVGWITLIEDSQSSTNSQPIDISDIVEITGATFKISKAGIVAKRIDLSKGYHVNITAVATTGEGLSGQSRPIFFGSSSLTINTFEKDVRVVISHPGSNLKRYVKMGNDTNKTISDVPMGNLAVTASKQGRSDFFILSKTNSRHQVDVDLSKEAIQRRQQTRASEKLKVRRSHVDQVGKNVSRTGMLPDCSTSGLWKRKIHEEGEFVPGIDLGVTSGKSDITDVDISNQPGFVRFACRVEAPSIYASWWRWVKSQDYESCMIDPSQWDENNNSEFNNLRDNSYDDQPLVLKYTIKGTGTGQIRTGTFETTVRQLRQYEGLKLANITETKGLYTHLASGGPTGFDFYKANYHFWSDKIRFPANFQNPTLTLEQSLFYKDVSGLNPARWPYYASCIVLGIDSPTVVEIASPKPPSNPVARPYKNSANSLDPEFGFFPAQVDSTINFPGTVHGNDMYFATYKLKIDTRGRNLTYTQVELSYELGSQVSSSPLIIPSGGITNLDTSLRPVDGTDSFEIRVDVAELTSGLNWVPGTEHITISFKPIATEPPDEGETGPQDVEITPYEATFTALYNAKVQSPAICSNGFYNPTGSVPFAQDRLLSYLQNKSATLGLRCNDMSLPFGGSFYLTSAWKHDGHKNGRIVDMRYFNTSATTQDNYDQIPSSSLQPRLSDVKTYEDFSVAAKAVAADATKKSYLHDFCTAGSASTICSSGTLLSEINQEMALKLCLKHSSAIDALHSGTCPTSSSNAAAAAIQFSKWVDLNYTGMTELLLGDQVTRIYMAFGSNVVGGSSLPNPYDWQMNAVFWGEWGPYDVTPDSPNKMIYKVTSGAIDFVQSITCHITNSCSIGSQKFTNSGGDEQIGKFIDDKGHLNHFDLEVR